MIFTFLIIIAFFSFKYFAVPDEIIRKSIQETSISINLSDRNLRNVKVTPLFIAINKQKNLQHLNLCGNFITNQSMEILCNALPSLESLKSLNLSLNHLTAEGLKYFSNIFEQSTGNDVLQHLTALDLSYNQFGDESLCYLAILSRYLKLEKLILIDVGFTSNIYKSYYNENIELCLDYMRHFDISNNELNKDDIIKILSNLNGKYIEYLNVSNNRINEEGLTWELVRHLDGINSCSNLKEIHLARCRLTDSEVYELLRLFLSSKCLNYLNLSYNARLTSLSLKRIIEQSDLLKSVSLIGCNDILKGFNNLEDEISLHPCNKLQKLILSPDVYIFNEECDMLISKFKKICFDNCYVRKSKNVLNIKLK